MNTPFNSIVNKNEASALKEMIFARARERNKAMLDEIQDNVMDMARNSFVSNNNPFSSIVQKAEATIEKTPNVTQEKPTEQENTIGFPQRNAQPQISQHNQSLSLQIASSEIQSNMLEAREGLSNKKSFMGALNFLNSQAAISLIRTRADKFEMVV